MQNQGTQSQGMQNQSIEFYCEGFAPLIAPNPKALILGTMPSVKSLENAFYYAHPRNQFWPIMHAITGLPIENNQQKSQLIQTSELALWDVLQTCERKGSLDSAIKKPKANDFASFLKQYPTIQHIVFNGKKSEQLFKQQVLKQQTLPEHIQYICMPSTSPANAALKKQDKQLFWQENLCKLL